MGFDGFGLLRLTVCGERGRTEGAAGADERITEMAWPELNGDGLRLTRLDVGRSTARTASDANPGVSDGLRARQRKETTAICL